MTIRASRHLDRRPMGRLFNSCWRSAQRSRRLMSRAVHGAEQAVGRARDHAAPMGDLPRLLQRLRLVADQVDHYLVVQAGAGVHRASFEEATRRVAKVVAASTRIEFAATSCVKGTRNSRERSIAASVDHEAGAILDELAADTGAPGGTTDRRSTSAP
jgi:hypothetical protein